MYPIGGYATNPMIPYLLDDKAVEGRAVRVDLAHYEVARVNRVRRPLLTLVSPDPCLMPRGRALWWARQPRGAPWVVHDVVAGPAAGATVTLKLTTSTINTVPAVGSEACFSIHSTKDRWLQQLPY